MQEAELSVSSIVSDTVSSNTALSLEQGWRIVKKTKKRRIKKPKPDVMIISSNGETSYADILRKLKADPEIKTLREEVNKIRSTQKGDLLLGPKTSNENIEERFNSKVVSLNGCAIVKTIIEEIIIES